MNIDVKEFKNFGYFLIDLKEEQLSVVKNEITEIQNNKDTADSISKAVDGHVSGTYRLHKSISNLESLVMPYFIDYDRHYNFIASNHSLFTDNVNIIMNDAWVSFQNKHEFNPAHRHPGVMSFVIWIDIPYTRKDEEKSSYGESKVNRAGAFTMYYNNSVGDIITEDILLDNNCNNKMILFPSKIKHSVSPFYSTDKTRVSVAGNFFFDTKQKDYNFSMWENDELNHNLERNER